jgi:hypothetical protein
MQKGKKARQGHAVSLPAGTAGARRRGGPLLAAALALALLPALLPLGPGAPAAAAPTALAANDLVEVTTGRNVLRDDLLGGDERLYGGVRGVLDIATALIPGGSKTGLVSRADDVLGFAAGGTTRAADKVGDAGAAAGGSGRATKPNYLEKVESPGDGQPPSNFTPEGAGRSGAFAEAKRASGIPTSQQPVTVLPASGREAGQSVKGRDYDFGTNDMGEQMVIREHFGHSCPDDPLQNRGTHFNDIHDNHYDYQG